MAAEPYLDQIIAVDLDSSEVGYPPRTFGGCSKRAREAGLRAVAHAGRKVRPSTCGRRSTCSAPSASIMVSAEEDDALVARLPPMAFLTMCPLSNVRLRVVDASSDHNLARLLDRGVKVTVNSDDPAYFGGYVADNYSVVAEALNLGPAELATLARNSVGGIVSPGRGQSQLGEGDRCSPLGSASGKPSVVCGYSGGFHDHRHAHHSRLEPLIAVDAVDVPARQGVDDVDSVGGAHLDHPSLDRPVLIGVVEVADRDRET